MPPTDDELRSLFDGRIADLRTLVAEEIGRMTAFPPGTPAHREAARRLAVLQDTLFVLQANRFRLDALRPAVSPQKRRDAALDPEPSASSP